MYARHVIADTQSFLSRLSPPLLSLFLHSKTGPGPQAEYSSSKDVFFLPLKTEVSPMQTGGLALVLLVLWLRDASSQEDPWPDVGGEWIVTYSYAERRGDRGASARLPASSM